MEADRELLSKGNAVRCLQCGTCTSSCTTNSVLPEYNPRRLIENILVSGVTPTLDEAWSCATCAACAERCPRGVSAMDIMLAVRSLYFREHGSVPDDQAEMLDSIVRTGRAFVAPDHVQDLRGELGLPDLSIDASAIAHIRSAVEGSGLSIQHRPQEGGCERK